MTPADLVAIRQVGDAQLSPDGRWVVYVVTEADTVRNTSNADLWLVSTSGGDPIRLTTSPRSDLSPRWSPDGTGIAFISQREDGPQIWLMRMSGGEPERLTSSKTGVQGIQWSPDGSTLVYVAPRARTPDEEKALVQRDARVSGQGERLGRIWLLDVVTRRVKELAAPELHLSDPVWSPDGREVAYVAVPSTDVDDGAKSDLYVTTLSDGAVRKLVENPGPDVSPRWSPDSRMIAFLGRPEGLGHRWLQVVPSRGGVPRVLTRDFRYAAGTPSWSRDGRQIYFTSLVGTTTQHFAVPVDGGESRQLTAIAGMMTAPTRSADGATAAFTLSTRDEPSDVYLVGRDRFGEPRRLTRHNPQLAEIARGRTQVVQWASRDGLTIEGLLMFPVGYDSTKRYPMVTFIHGGPAGIWARGFPGNVGDYGHIWSGQGWVTFYPNIRGSTGYGEPFMTMNVRDWGGHDYEDVQAGIDYLIARGIADSTRLGQTGWSYGGYLTAWTMTRTDRFRALMVGAGMTNLYSMYSTHDTPDALAQFFRAKPWDDPEIYRRQSPMTYITRARTRTMIMHGEQDRRVPLGQAYELYIGLRDQGVPVTLVVYPREGHGMMEPRHQLDKMERELRFFTEALAVP